MNNVGFMDTHAISLSQVGDNLESLGVPFPPVPRELTEWLMPLSELAFGSAETGVPLYQLQRFVEQLTPDWPLDYLYFGVSGHGVNSRAVHFYLLNEHCAVFVQRAMAVLSPSTFNSETFARLMEQAAELSCDPDLENLDGRLVVVDSDLMNSRIGLWRDGQLSWHKDVPLALEYARSQSWVQAISSSRE